MKQKKFKGIAVEGFVEKIEVYCFINEVDSVISKMTEKKYKYYDGEGGFYNEEGDSVEKLVFIKENRPDYI